MTPRQRAQKIAKAQRLIVEARDLLREVYDEYRDTSWKLFGADKQAHYDIGMALGGVNKAVVWTRDLA